uniref:Uncharacterized protein n=2 Tax=Arundo donax TaxID=35708 RepID=A0A0A9G8X3_ARUDO
MSSSPLSSVLTRIMPAPPACFTAAPFATRALLPRSQSTILPATLSGSSSPCMQSREPQSPAYTTGNIEFRGSPAYRDTPPKTRPSPRTTSAGNSRSMVDAPTVSIHGAMLTAVYSPGPELPAEQETTIPLLIAWKAPMAIESRKKLGAYPLAPTEREMTSTPSATASSMAARMSES